MKYTLEQKLEAVRRKLEDKATVYPESCTMRRARRTFQKHLAFWAARFKEGGEDVIENVSGTSPFMKRLIERAGLGCIDDYYITPGKWKRMLGFDWSTLQTGSNS